MDLSRDSQTELGKQVSDLFHIQFGGTPERLVAAPGRVNLIGEHVDYNQGIALPFAVNRWTTFAWRRRDDQQVAVWSNQSNQRAEFNLDQPLRREPGRNWLNYLLGVAHELHSRGVHLRGVDVAIDSNLPVGGGLSSSAALTTGFATAMLQAAGERIDSLELARLCQSAEHQFSGVPCGLMDPLACLLGRANHLLKIDFDQLAIETIPFDDPQVSLLVVHSGVSHSLAAGEYAIRRAQCEEAAQRLGVPSLRHVTNSSDPLAETLGDPVLLRRVQHVREEIERVNQAVDAVRNREWDRLGRLMSDSHESLSKLYEVSCPELDLLVDLLCRQAGVFGARMTGGGFGGCAIALVQTHCLSDVVVHATSEYQRQTGFAPWAFPAVPSKGALCDSP